VKSFNLDESASKELEGRIPRAIEDLISKGAPNSDIMEFLTAKVGMEEPEAQKWVEAARGNKQGKKKPAEPAHQPMFG